MQHFVDYRQDVFPLQEMVERRLTQLGITDRDREDIFTLLKPLKLKQEAGVFHVDHCLRVGLLASEIAEVLYFDAKALLFAGLLHDIGKALVPACVLGRTEKWTKEDQVEIEHHVMDGFRLLRDRFDFSAQVIVWHHRFQQHAYPKELPKALQPFSEETLKKVERDGYVLAMADVFDALHRVNSATEGQGLSSDEVRARMCLLFQKDVELIQRLYVAKVFR